MSLLRVTAIIGGAAVVAFVWKVVWPWVFGGQFKNIPGPRRKSWWRGNYGAIFERDSWDYHRDLWESYGGCFKIYGLFGDEQLYLTDPEAVTIALCKETEKVTVTDLVLTSNMAIFGPGMTSTSGDLHKKQRKVVNPVFSGQHMKATTPLFYPPMYELMKIIEDLVKDGPAEVDWMKYLSLGTLEFLGRVGLGYSFGTLDVGKKKSEYHTAVSAITGVALDIAVLSLFMPFLTAVLPGWVRQKIVDWTPWPSLQRMNYITKVMDKTSRDIFYSKKEALARGESLLDKDILNVLMQSNDAADEEDRLPDEQIIGQLSAIIFAGNDTTSVMLSRLLHNLAMRQDVQQKLREEIIEARLNYGDMDWDQLNSLPYMEAVVKEVFRRFPSVPFLTRTVRKPIVLKLRTPIKGVDGRMIDTIPIKANTDLIISVMGMNRQTCVWGKDADDFKPERWLNPLPESYTNANVPGVFPGLLTFMAGRKACPGFKFAEIEIKLLISLVMEKFQFDLSDNDHNVLWCIGHLSKPQVLNNEDFNTPSLPLKVILLKKTQ